jgi:hypothetical protein
MNGGLKVCGIMVQVTHEELLSSFKKKLITKLQKRGEIILVGNKSVQLKPPRTIFLSVGFMEID